MPRVPEPSPSPSSTPRLDVDLLLRALAAVLAAGAFCVFAWDAYPKALDVRTDIVGYPITQNFNPGKYSAAYLLITVAFPALAIAGWSLLEWLAARRRGNRRQLLPRSLPATDPDPPAERLRSPLLAHLKLVVVGMLAATAIAVATGASSAWPLTIALPVTVAYVVAARVAAGRLARRRDASEYEALAAVNAAVGSLALVGIALGSEAARVDVASLGRAVHYSIAPLPILLGVALAVAALVGWRLRRSPPAAWRGIEAWTLLLAVAPVLLYLAFARISGELGPPDLFHAGERLGASTLVFDGGELPWRDLIFVHGLLYDVAVPGLDTAAVEDSHWGLEAAVGLVEAPLFWVAMLLLCVYLFRRNWPFLVATQALLLFGWLDGLENSRMIFLPLSLLAMAALLHRSTWPRAVLVMSLTLAQAIMVPEATGFSVAVWVLILAFELVHRRVPGGPELRSSRTVRCAISGAVLVILFVGYLAISDSLDGFVSYYRTFLSNHALTGGHEIEWSDLRFHLYAYIPVAAILISWLYAAARIYSGRWFTVADWVVGAAVIGLIPYYEKFLGRPDFAHLGQVAVVALVPALYIVYRVVQHLDGEGERSGVRALSYRPATLALLAFVLVVAPTSTLSVIRDLPQHFEGSAAAAPANERLGYVVPGPDDTLPADVQRVIDTYAPGGKVFDFTNSPLLFDFLVDDEPATRFYHVSMAIRSGPQEELVDELEDEQPDLVAYSSRLHGLPSWDGISNPVRHYLVSDYLLDHYHPVAEVEDYVFMARNDAAAARPAVDDPNGLYFDGLPCEWRYAPEFLDQEPAAGAREMDVGVRPAGTSTLIAVRGWAADLNAGTPAERILVAAGDSVVADGPVGINTGDPSGFLLSDLLVPGDVTAPGSLRVFGVNADGIASELGTPASAPPRELRNPDGSTVHVANGAVAGNVDFLKAGLLARERLELPRDFSDYDWLRVDADGPLGANRFLVSGARSEAGETIGFSSLPDSSSESEQVRVGACPQWKGYAGGPVFLNRTGDAQSVAVRLVR